MYIIIIIDRNADTDKDTEMELDTDKNADNDTDANMKLDTDRNVDNGKDTDNWHGHVCYLAVPV